jgi:DNA mismatch repair ATPase MutL
VELSPSAVEATERRADTLVRLGLDVRSRESGVVSVHTVPRLLARLSAEEYLHIVCSVWAEETEGSDEASAVILARLACAEALPQQQRIQRETGESLLRSLAHADLSLPALHGKVIVSLTDFRELDRRAGRHE